MSRSSFERPTDALTPVHTQEPATLQDLLSLRADKDADHVGFISLAESLEEEGRLTYGVLYARARAIAGLLEQCGSGSRPVALLYPPGLDYVVAFFGCICAGVPAVPLYPPINTSTLHRVRCVLANSDAGVLLTNTTGAAAIAQGRLIEDSLSELQMLNTDTLRSKTGSEEPMRRVTPDGAAVIQYTSGSTRQPRGVVLSHANLMYNLSQIRARFENDENGCGVTWLPLYHDMGLIGGVLQPIFARFPAIMLSPSAFLHNPLRWLHAISASGAKISGAPNFAYSLCVERFKPENAKQLDLSAWEVAFCGAEPVRATTLKRFAAVFKPYGFRESAFCPCYGLAEATLMVTARSKSEPLRIIEVNDVELARNVAVVDDSENQKKRSVVSCGRSLTGQRLLIVDPEERLILPEGRVGEIWVSGPSVASGYWNRRAETDAVFNWELANTLERGFLRTGDLGFLADGDLFVTGRLKEIIIINGRNFYPHDIEEAITSVSPDFRAGEGVAFSVDSDCGERLVVVQEFSCDHNPLNSETLRMQARRVIAENFGIELYDFVIVRSRTLSKTTSGKPRRLDTRADYIAGRLSVVEGRGRVS